MIIGSMNVVSIYQHATNNPLKHILHIKMQNIEKVSK